MFVCMYSSSNSSPSSALPLFTGCFQTVPASTTLLPFSRPLHRSPSSSHSQITSSPHAPNIPLACFFLVTSLFPAVIYFFSTSSSFLLQVFPLLSTLAAHLASSSSFLPLSISISTQPHRPTGPSLTSDAPPGGSC